MLDLLRVARPNGGILSLRMLEQAAVHAHHRTRLVKSGELVRLRNGWFAVQGADPERAKAVRIGGVLTCSSRLRQEGLWVMPDSRIHVSVAENASRLRDPDDRAKAWQPLRNPGIVLHWAPYSPPTDTVIDTLHQAITHLVRCSSRDSALVTIDSALNTTRHGEPLLTQAELEHILAALPAKYSRLADMADPRSQSGLETLARLRLRSRGIQVQSQAMIDGVGHVDLLIGDRLVLELDSRTHHLGENYEKDRTRDLELFRQGFLVLRVSYRRVMFDWKSVETAILAAVRRGDHERKPMHDRLDLARVRHD